MLFKAFVSYGLYVYIVFYEKKVYMLISKCAVCI